MVAASFRLLSSLLCWLGANVVAVISYLLLSAGMICSLEQHMDSATALQELPHMVRANELYDEVAVCGRCLAEYLCLDTARLKVHDQESERELVRSRSVSRRRPQSATISRSSSLRQVVDRASESRQTNDQDSKNKASKKRRPASARTRLPSTTSQAVAAPQPYMGSGTIDTAFAHVHSRSSSNVRGAERPTSNSKLSASLKKRTKGNCKLNPKQPVQQTNEPISNLLAELGWDGHGT